MNERRFSDLLPNHTLVKHDYSFGATRFDYGYAYDQISAVRDSLGYATIASVASGVTMGLIGVLEDLGIDQPVIGSSNTAIALSSRENWPLY